MRKISSSSILVLLAALAVSPAYSQKAGGQPSAAGPAVQAESTFPIWPGKAPGSEDWTFSESVMEGPGGSKTYSNVVNPTLTVFLPETDKANGTAIILCPGGAMRMLGFAEPERTAQWLNSKGIAAFILKYRVVPNTQAKTNGAPSAGPSGHCQPPRQGPAGARRR